MQVVQRSQKSINEEPRRGSRPRNATFLFDPAHAAYEFYCQRLCSKLSTPILASVQPPPYPGDKPHHAPEYGFKHSKKLLDTCWHSKYDCA